MHTELWQAQKRTLIVIIYSYYILFDSFSSNKGVNINKKRGTVCHVLEWRSWENLCIQMWNSSPRQRVRTTMLLLYTVENFSGFQSQDKHNASSMSLDNCPNANLSKFAEYAKPFAYHPERNAVQWSKHTTSLRASIASLNDTSVAIFRWLGT